MNRLLSMTGALILSLLISGPAVAGEKNEINILFLGNSFTFRHELPDLVKTVVEEGQPGLTVNARRITYGGQNMFKHYTYYFSESFLEQSTISNETIENRIRQMEGFLALKNDPPEFVDYHKGGKPAKFSDIHKNIKGAIKNHKKLLEENPRTKWDCVVLQSWQDVDPSLDKAYAKYARKFAEAARGQGTKVILYITAPNMQNNKPVTEPQLQERVDLEVKLAVALAKEIDAYAVVPVPLAINMIQQGGTDLTFCYVNDFHPNQYTAFLTSNMFYAALFKKSPEGFKYNTVTETNPKGQGEGKDPDGGDATVEFDTETKKYLQKMAFDAVVAFDQKLR